MSRPLLIATAGGHLTQLFALAPRLGIDVASAQWVTTATAQSRSLLAERDVVWAPYTRPRDLLGLARHAAIARRTVSRGDFSVAVSTGASLAPPFMVAAQVAGVPAHYIESATRVTGPSLAGRLTARIPGVRLYSQYPSWAQGRWQYGGSVFDGWLTRDSQRPMRLKRLLVTVGSARGFPFHGLIDAVKELVPASCDVTWQVSDADTGDLPGRVVRDLPFAEMRELLRTSDVVVSHAGTGSVLAALDAGRYPIVVPRTMRRGEHVDDHQAQIARMLAERDLAMVREAEDLRLDDLFFAAGREAVRTDAVPFLLS